MFNVNERMMEMTGWVVALKCVDNVEEKESNFMRKAIYF